MRSKFLLDILEDAARALGLVGIGEDAYVRPNELAEPTSDPVRFETFVSDFSTRPDAEESAVTVCSGGIIVSGPRGEGIERVDAVAQALADLFAPYGAFGARGWTFQEPLFGTSARRVSRVYAAGVERSNGTVVDGRYKVKITVRLEIYEEKTL